MKTKWLTRISHKIPDALPPDGGQAATKFRKICGLMAGLLVVLTVGVAGCARIRPPAGVAPVERMMEVTGYCKCGKCCGWERTWYGKPVYSSGPQKGKRKRVGITASGVSARKGTIAADTSRYPFGTIMYIDGYGYGRVEDRGGAMKGNKIDLFFNSHRAALEWGRKTIKVKIWHGAE